MTIPASAIVTVNPAVLGTGGSPLAMNGVIMSQNVLLPTNKVQAFASALAVAAFFGQTSQEYALADTYFLGYDNSTIKPGTLFFAPFNLTARAAWLQTGFLGTMTLQALQALSGAINITVDGYPRTAASINLASATSFSVAASMVQTALNAAEPTEATCSAGTIGASATGSIGATFTASGSGTTLTVTAVTGYIAIGDTIAGTGVPANTTIISQNSGGTPHGGGTYITSQATTASSATVTSFGNVVDITAISYGGIFTGDVISGTGIPSGAAITGQLTGTTASTGTYTISIPATAYAASTAITDLSSVMLVAGTITGAFATGQTVSGTTVAAGSVITGQLSIIGGGAPNGAGTYSLSASSTVGAVETLTAKATDLTVNWSSVLSCFILQSGITGAPSTMGYATGTLAASLAMNQITGAILSQGAAADTETTAMNSVVANTQNWVDFMTMWEPNLASKEAFAVWTNAQNQRYAYIAWDTDAQAVVNGSMVSFGAVAKYLKYDGIVPVYNDVKLASFVLGAVACIDFSRTNARITTAFKSQAGFAPTVDNQQIGANLIANGYSFYGAYATANDEFNFFYPGSMSGRWKWLDTFVNQVYLNSQFQLALLSLLTVVGSIPYNDSGYGLIRAAMEDPINAALNFGSIRTGINLSMAQKAEVANAAGKDVSGPLQQNGYYLQILDPGAQVRGNRGTPVINFWYTDGGAVQTINVASIDVM